MARRRTLELTADARTELEQVRDHDASPAMRERAAALLKIAEGQSPHHVARHSLLKPRDPETVCGWLDRYQAAGIAGLRAHRHGGSVRGRLRRRAGAGTPRASPWG